MGISGTSTTLISKNTEVVGDIHFTGTLHIEGKLRGNVIAKDGSDAHLDIAEKGLIEGQIDVPTVRINGRVIGDVFSGKHVELSAKAEVEGNVHYHLIEMVKGAQVNGSFVYTGAGDKAKKQQKPSNPTEEPLSSPQPIAGSSSF